MRLIALALALLPLQALAQPDTGLSALQTGDASRGWEAVGRLNVEGGGFCTATLIAADRVLTAAHCLYDRDSGARIPAERLEFLAGWRLGRAEAVRGIRRVAIWPQFDVAAGAALTAVAGDLAVLELDRPVRTTTITPFALAELPVQPGDIVTVVSYARNRAEAPSLQEACQVLDQREDGVAVFSCDIDYGSSGAPVFVRMGAGYRIVSLISARVEGSAQPMSLGMRLAGRVQELEQSLGSPLSLPAGVPAPEGGGARGTARFLRP